MHPTTRYHGRPLYFITLVLLLWIAGRAVALLLPHNAVASPATKPPPGISQHTPVPVAAPADSGVRNKHGPAPSARIAVQTHQPFPLLHRGQSPAQPMTPYSLPLAAPGAVTPHDTPPRHGVVIPAAAPHSAPSAENQWSATAWLLWRQDGVRSSLAAAGRLGGSQAGLRIDYRLATPALGTFSGYARLSAALDRPHGGEGALGISLHPSLPMPVSLGIERRGKLSEGGRDALALIAAAGLGPHDLGSHLRVEGYAQAGIVGLHRADGFIDGRLALTHDLIHPRVAAGLSVSGGTQPGLSRLDIGPVAELSLHLGTVQPRLRLEWRERVMGNATPGSGLTLTLASDF